MPNISASIKSALELTPVGWAINFGPHRVHRKQAIRGMQVASFAQDTAALVALPAPHSGVLLAHQDVDHMVALRPVDRFDRNHQPPVSRQCAELLQNRQTIPAGMARFALGFDHRSALRDPQPLSLYLDLENHPNRGLTYRGSLSCFDDRKKQVIIEGAASELDLRVMPPEELMTGVRQMIMADRVMEQAISHQTHALLFGLNAPDRLQEYTLALLNRDGVIGHPSIELTEANILHGGAIGVFRGEPTTDPDNGETSWFPLGPAQTHRGSGDSTNLTKLPNGNFRLEVVDGYLGMTYWITITPKGRILELKYIDTSQRLSKQPTTTLPQDAIVLNGEAEITAWGLPTL